MRIDRDRGLAGLAIANDQFALATTNRDQGIKRLQAGLHGLVHRLARDNARRLDFDAAAFLASNRALAVDRVAQAINNAAEQSLADGHVNDGTGPFDRVAFLDVPVTTENNDTDIVGLEVQRHTLIPPGNSTISPAWTLSRP